MAADFDNRANDIDASGVSLDGCFVEKSIASYFSDQAASPFRIFADTVDAICEG